MVTWPGTLLRFGLPVRSRSRAGRWRADVAVAWRAFWTTRLLVWVAGARRARGRGASPCRADGLRPGRADAAYGPFGDTLVAPGGALGQRLVPRDRQQRLRPGSAHARSSRSTRGCQGARRRRCSPGSRCRAPASSPRWPSLHRLARLELGDEAARLAVLALALFPGSLFFSAVYSRVAVPAALGRRGLRGAHRTAGPRRRASSARWRRRPAAPGSCCSCRWRSCGGSSPGHACATRSRWRSSRSGLAVVLRVPRARRAATPRRRFARRRRGTASSPGRSSASGTGSSPRCDGVRQLRRTARARRSSSSRPAGTRSSVAGHNIKLFAFLARRGRRCWSARCAACRWPTAPTRWRRSRCRSATRSGRSR